MIGTMLLVAYVRGLAEGAGHAVGFILTFIALVAFLIAGGRWVYRIWSRGRS